MLHICNECDIASECKYAYTSILELWCAHPSELIRKKQDDKFTKNHEDDWGYWTPQ